MAQKNYIAVVAPANDKLADGEGYLLADLQEGGLTIKADLAELIKAGKTDRGINSVKEDIKLTVGRIAGDKGQDQLENAIRDGQELRVWIFETKKYDDGYHAIFAYVHGEEYEWSFDDEDDKIELKLAVKWNTAKGAQKELPPEWLDPASYAPVVEFEEIGEYSGSFENRKANTSGKRTATASTSSSTSTSTSNS